MREPGESIHVLDDDVTALQGHETVLAELHQLSNRGLGAGADDVGQLFAREPDTDGARFRTVPEVRREHEQRLREAFANIRSSEVRLTFLGTSQLIGERFGDGVYQVRSRGEDSPELRAIDLADHTIFLHLRGRGVNLSREQRLHAENVAGLRKIEDVTAISRDALVDLHDPRPDAEEREDRCALVVQSLAAAIRVGDLRTIQTIQSLAIQAGEDPLQP